MLCLPVAMGAVWLAGQRHDSSATASVSIDTDQVVALRSTVISHLTGVGAVKTAETTTYGGGGQSDLTFRIPPARIDDTLAELNSVGGTLVEQKVQLDGVSDAANGVSVGLDGLSNCIGNLTNRATGGQIGTNDLGKCQARIAVIDQSLKATTNPVQDAVIDVHIRRTSTRNPWLLVAVVVLALALAAMAYFTFRSAQIDRMIDLSEETNAPSPLDELYVRRN